MASKDAKRPTPTSRDQSEGVPNPSVTHVSLGSRRRGVARPVRRTGRSAVGRASCGAPSRPAAPLRLVRQARVAERRIPRVAPAARRRGRQRAAAGGGRWRRRPRDYDWRARLRERCAVVLGRLVSSLRQLVAARRNALRRRRVPRTDPRPAARLGGPLARAVLERPLPLCRPLPGPGLCPALAPRVGPRAEQRRREGGEEEEQR